MRDISRRVGRVRFQGLEVKNIKIQNAELPCKGLRMNISGQPETYL